MREREREKRERDREGQRDGGGREKEKRERERERWTERGESMKSLPDCTSDKGCRHILPVDHLAES